MASQVSGTLFKPKDRIKQNDHSVSLTVYA